MKDKKNMISCEDLRRDFVLLHFIEHISSSHFLRLLPFPFPKKVPKKGGDEAGKTMS